MRILHRDNCQSETRQSRLARGTVGAALKEMYAPAEACLAVSQVLHNQALTNQIVQHLQVDAHATTVLNNACRNNHDRSRRHTLRGGGRLLYGDGRKGHACNRDPFGTTHKARRAGKPQNELLCACPAAVSFKTTGKAVKLSKGFLKPTETNHVRKTHVPKF